MLRARHGIVLAVLGLLVVATVMVNSASLNLSRGGETTLDSVFWGKHTWFALGAAMALLVGAMVPVDRLGRTGATWWTTPVFWVAVAVVVGLALVQVPGIGREVNGARRWISLGPVGLQPSELAKWGVPVLLAWYAIRNRARMQSFKWGFAVPLAAVSAVCAVIAIEDLGTAVLIDPVLLVMLLAAGARVKHLAIVACAAVLLAPCSYPFLRPHQRARIDALVAQVMGDTRHNDTIGFQGSRAITLAASGGVLGLGKEEAGTLIRFNRLPEEHNDMIFVVIACRWGLAGGLAVWALAAAYAFGAYQVAARAGTSFGRLVATGIAGTFIAQLVINTGMTVGVLPVTGVTLPFISYGGSSLVAMWISTGLLFNLAMRRPRGSERLEVVT